MATTTKPAPATVPDVFKLTVERYHQMIDGGILNEYDDVELIEGVIRSKMSKGRTHETILEKLNRLLTRVLPDDVSHRCQGSFTLEDSEPEPDLLVCTTPEARNDEHPRAADSFIVIEVSDSSLAYDRGDKLRIYARAGVPVYWVVNVVDRQVEVSTDPQPGGTHYRSRRIYTSSESVPLVVRGQQVGAVAVADFMP